MEFVIRRMCDIYRGLSESACSHARASCRVYYAHAMCVVLNLKHALMTLNSEGKNNKTC